MWSGKYDWILIALLGVMLGIGIGLEISKGLLFNY